MTRYYFDLYVDKDPAEVGFEAAGFSMKDGEFYLAFVLESDTYDNAVEQATKLANKAGLTVTRVEKIRFPLLRP